MPSYYDLGNHSRPISTASSDAQLWFDRGLIWTYGFNHEEAIRCFEKACAYDPNCAMAYWGIAYALGPNYNKPWEAFDDAELAANLSKAVALTRRARTLVADGTASERALVNALQARYPTEQHPTEQPPPAATLRQWNDAYAAAMRQAYRADPDDLDLAALFAEALLNRTPWQLWDLRSGEPAEDASTLEAQTVLERALERTASRAHPGVLHMYIHLMEMSPHPESAARASDWLRGLCPDAGHLQHMPSHIDVLCGRYDSAVQQNDQAIAADAKFLEREGALNFYSLYRAHNYHFKLYAAMFLGQSENALAAADGLISTIPDKLLVIDSPPMADWLEAFVPTRMHVLIRFGRWQEIIDAPLPKDRELFCFTTAVSHYAKGVALAATGRVDGAEQQRELFEATTGRVPETRYLFNNTCIDILAVAREMLNGEIEYRKQNYDQAFARLRRAIELDDGLPFDEPWGWMQPTRHAYGALLLEQGHVEQAEAVYRADLGLDPDLPRPYQHPENVWSLHGYHECLTRLGRDDLARIIEQRLRLVAARADVPIETSCYCRTSHAA
ncbi:MAG: tetratricopeptide repeat protein [Pseudomonadales bacterium]